MYLHALNPKTAATRKGYMQKGSQAAFPGGIGLLPGEKGTSTGFTNEQLQASLCSGMSLILPLVQ